MEVGRKIIRRRGLAAQGFAIADLLNVAQAAGHALIAIGIESVEIDGHTSIAPGVHLGAVQNRLNGAIHDLRCRGAVGVEEEAVLG